MGAVVTQFIDCINELCAYVCGTRLCAIIATTTREKEAEPARMYYIFVMDMLSARLCFVFLFMKQKKEKENMDLIKGVTAPRADIIDIIDIIEIIVDYNMCWNTIC